MFILSYDFIPLFIINNGKKMLKCFWTECNEATDTTQEFVELPTYSSPVLSFIFIFIFSFFSNILFKLGLEFGILCKPSHPILLKNLFLKP